jgi:hypothetical protein
MASNVDVVRRVAEVLMRRPEVRQRASRARSDFKKDGIGLSTKPNAPKLVTIFVAVALTVVGLAVSDTVAIKPVTDLLADNDLTLTVRQGWLLLLASPTLLVLGSFFRGL